MESEETVSETGVDVGAVLRQLKKRNVLGVIIQESIIIKMQRVTAISIRHNGRPVWISNSYVRGKKKTTN